MPRSEFRLWCLALLVWAALASPSLAAGQQAANSTKPFKSLVECITASLGLLDNVQELLEDPDLVECAGGPTEKCCSYMNRVYGEDSDLWGCNCHEVIRTQSMQMIPEYARALAGQRMVECGMPTVYKGCDPEADAAREEQAKCSEPDFNQTRSMKAQSGAYSKIREGLSAYGDWKYCNDLEGAQYCLVLMVPPGGFYGEVSWGFCVPGEENQTALNERIMDNITSTAPDHYALQMPKVYCGRRLFGDSEHLPKWTPGFIASLALWAAFALLVLVATTVAWCNWNWSWSYEREAWYSVLASFDWRTSWAIFSSDGAAPSESGIDLKSLNGLRTLSMLWVILSHTISEVYQKFFYDYFGNMAVNPEYYWWVKAWYFPIYCGYFAVDTFLFISALLVAYKLSEVMLRRKKKPFRFLDSCKFWVTFIFARWCRLVPVLVMVIISAIYLVPSTVNGPRFGLFWRYRFIEPCEKYWWATLLFIQNYYPGESDDYIGSSSNVCLGPTWYLAVDMQLYVFVAPVVLAAWHFTGRKRMVIGSAFIAFLLLLFVGITAYIVVDKNVMWQLYGVGNYKHYYTRPWVHAPAYLFGLIGGIGLHEMSQERGRKMREYLMTKAQSWAIWLVWLVNVGVLVLLILAPHFYMANTPGKMPPLVDTVDIGMTAEGAHTYMICKNFGWGLCLLILSGINMLGRGGIVNDFLSGYIFGPFAKLTYCAYLIGTTLQAALAQSQFTYVRYSHFNVVSWWTSMSAQAYFLSLVCFMLIEAPFGNLLKLLLCKSQGQGRGADLEPAGTLKIRDEGKGLEAKQADDYNRLRSESLPPSKRTGMEDVFEPSCDGESNGLSQEGEHVSQSGSPRCSPKLGRHGLSGLYR